jgi:type VI protein secretion system component Hcp
MAWSNIFLQLVTPAGPVIGEGLLEGWQTSIELNSFKWELTYSPEAKPATKTSLGAAVGGALLALVGGASKNVTMGKLEFEKRFDISSAMMHTCLDNHIPIISASITVLNIKHGGRAIHEPGFTLVAADGYITDVALAMTPSGHSVEVKETVTFDFKSIVISYLKQVGKDNIPTNPFFYVAPDKPSALGSL